MSTAYAWSCVPRRVIFILCGRIRVSGVDAGTFSFQAPKTLEKREISDLFLGGESEVAQHVGRTLLVSTMTAQISHWSHDARHLPTT